MAMVGLELGSLEFVVVTSKMLLMRSSSHLLCDSNLLISRGLNVPSAFPLWFRIPSQIPFFSWDPWRLPLPTLSHQVVQIIVTVSRHAVSQVVFSRHDLF